MKKLVCLLAVCLTLALTSCGDSPAKRVDKMKAMYDEMYEMAGKYGCDNDSVISKFKEITNYNTSEIMKDIPEWSQEERDYYNKVFGECMNNPMLTEITLAAMDSVKNDPNYGKRPEDSDLEKAVDQAKSAADNAKDAADNAVKGAKDAAGNAVNDAKNAVKGL